MTIEEENKMIEERMRKKLDTEYKCFTVEEFKSIRKDLELLKQYKTIEEELGIDLITLFKALKNGIWTNQEQTYGDAKQGKIRFFKVVLLLEEKSIGCIHNSIWKGEEVIKRLYLKNYRKTWALRKEDLENDK